MNTSLCLIRPDNYLQEVVLALKPVLVLCMPFNEEFPSQLKIVEEVASSLQNELKVGLLEEAFIDTFKKNLQISGTPTFLFMVKGKEKSRMIGLTDLQALADFVTTARKTVEAPSLQNTTRTG
ncbi:MAG: thioredoxin family protein [Desulfatitalea sp.]|nr:thioredoxin family protein [Desulfatitalea sp.]